VGGHGTGSWQNKPAMLAAPRAHDCRVTRGIVEFCRFSSELRGLVPRALAELIPLAANGLDTLRRAYVVVQFPAQP
jgi:hypothetical protein